MIIDPFEGKMPDHILWVDVNAPRGGNGTEDWPINSIQRATAKAQPGTAIMVKEGTYHENVYIARTSDGTPDKPVWLISADGPGKAHIIAPGNGLAAIGGGGVQNWVVDGFWTTGGKNGIHFGQNGYDYSDMTANIVIRNNFIENPVQDGVKLNGGDNVYVIGNTIVGGKDEGIDLFAINGGTVAYNDVSGNTGTSAAIFAKAGSVNIKIVNNYVHDNKAVGISLGGWVDATLDHREGTEGFQVRDVVVSGNVVTNSGRTPLASFGAHDAVVTGNYFEANAAYHTPIWIGPANLTQYGIATSKNVAIYDNVVTEHRKSPKVDASSENVTFNNNGLGVTVSADAGPAALARHLAAEAKDAEPTPEPAPEPATDPVAQTPGETVPDATEGAVTPVEVPAGTTDVPAKEVPVPPVAETAPPASIPSAPGDPFVGKFQLIQLKEFLGVEWAQSASATQAIRGGSGIGTAGNDAISGNAARYQGGAGDDVYTLNAERAATIVERAGEGIDTLLSNGRQAMLVDNVENLVHTSGIGAILTGNSGDNRISGNTGDDFLIGNGGKNLLEGGKGTDRFVVDTDDMLTRIVDLEAGEAINIVGLQAQTFDELKKQMVEVDGTTMIDLGDGRVVILDGVGISDLSATQFSLEASTAKGLAQSGAVTGTKIAPNSSLNTAIGTEGNDQIYGNGTAMLVGGDGDDMYFVRGEGDRVFESAGGGNDTVLLYANSYTMDAGVENVNTKNDTGVSITGNGLANIINGGDGADRIAGGAGADRLTGGGGDDVFVYSSLRDGGDTITDFTAGQDMIDVSALRANIPEASFRLDYSSAGMATLYASVDGVDHVLASLVYKGMAPTMSDLII